MKKIYTIILLASIYILSSCTQEDVTHIYYTDEEHDLLSQSLNLPMVYDDFTVDVPNHLFEGKSLSTINVGANHTATLGRVLFYDTRLSSSNTISCGSCHKQEFAFSDDKSFSDGVGEMITSRNSLALAAAPNLSASYESEVSESFFGWDHSNFNSQSQSLAAILNEREMGNTNFRTVVERLQGLPEYRLLTRKAFGHEDLQEFELLFSLDAFMNSISSFNSKFDRGLETSFRHLAEEDFINFSSQENLGKRLFNNNCGSCHGSKHDIQLMQIANNGLDLIYDDKGVGALENRFNQEDQDGLFKVPFLRNIALTAPYMHDGRFATLEEVVEHYNSGIKQHKNLSSQLQENNTQPIKMNLSENDKQALVSYLETLTDNEITKAEKYSNPFK